MNEATVRDLILDYLAGAMSLRDLDRGLSAVSWDVEATPSVRDLANAIALRVDEFSSEACDESELRTALVPFVTDYVTAVIVGPVQAIQVETSLSSSFTASSLTATPTIVDTRRAEALS